MCISDFDLRSSNCITYRNIFDGADVIYKVDNGTIKEYIVLNHPDCPSEFWYSIDTRRYMVEKTDEGTIAVYNTAGNLVFEFGRLFAVDSLGDRTDDVSYEMIEETEGTSVIKILVNTDYLRDPNRSYPVLVDPSVMVTGASDTYDTYVSSRYPTTNYYLYNWLRTGRDEDYYTRRTYIKFDIPNYLNKENCDRVSYAYINIRKYSGSTPNVRAYRVVESWSSSSLTWNNKPSYASLNASQIAFSNDNGWYKLVVADIVKSWLDTTNVNYGFLLQDDTESGETQWTTFYSSDAASPNEPELHIYYTEGKY